jgi:hypothetical protein
VVWVSALPWEQVSLANVFPDVGDFNLILELKFLDLMIYSTHSVAIRPIRRPLTSVQRHSIAAVDLRKDEFFFGTGLVPPDRQLRITRRCLEDDLGADEGSSIEAMANQPIVKAFVRERRDKFEGSSRVEPIESGKEIYVLRHQHEHRGATWHDKSQNIVWLVAYGRHESGVPGDFFPWCKELDKSGVLLPSVQDYEDFYREGNLRLARMLMVEPPLLLKRARESGQEETARIGGLYGTAVSIELADEIEAISVAFDTRSENFYRTLPVILAAFIPNAGLEDWSSLDRMPSRILRDYEIGFSFVGEIP